MRAGGAGDLASHRQGGVQRGHRVLQHERDLLPADPLELPLAHRGEVPPRVEDAPARDPPPVGQQAEQALAEHRLAAAALPNDRERLPRAKGEGDAAHRPDDAARGVKRDLQIPHLKQRVHGHSPFRRASSL